MALRPREYVLLATGKPTIGLVAEEAVDVIPQAVGLDDDGAPLSIDYAQVTVALLKHVQALTARVEALEAAAPESEV
jgi:hypothetical protein